MLFDYDRYCAVASSLYQLIAGPGAFDSLAADPVWRQRHEQALTALLETSDTLQRTLSVASHDRAVVRFLLLFVQDVFEGACKHFAATILAQIGPRTYAALMDMQRSAALIHQVNDQPRTRTLSEGLLGSLRNSSGHYDFDVRGELVVLNPGPREEAYTAEAFTDELLYFVESAAALCLAFEIALMQRGLPTATPAGHPLLAPDYVLRLLATAAGLKNVDVIIEASEVSVVGTGAVASPIPTVGALLTIIPETIETLTFTWDDGERLRQLAVPLSLARAHMKLEPESFEKELAFIELCRMTTLNGQPYYTLEAFRHWVALQAGAAVKAPPIQSGQRYRVLRALATRVGDLHCAEVLRLVTRARRLIAQNEQVDPEALTALDELSAWESTPVTDIFAEA